jgi:Ca-activated chloride channel family protein
MDDKAIVRTRTSVLAVLVVALLLPRPGGGAPPPVTFEAEVEVVNLNVSVVDALGHFVTGLGRPDFAVFEDGIKQQLSIFDDEELPISLVLMIDGSASMLGKLEDTRAAAARFVETLTARDVAQVTQFNDRINVLQDFTSDQKALAASLERTDASGPTSLHNALYVSLKELEKEKRKGGELRRRAIIILSDGEDTSSLVSDEQVLELAKKTEISIYPIMLRARGGERDRPKFSQATYLLNTLAQDSGGQAFQPNSLTELEDIYERISQELRTLYSVGYVSSNPRRDGKWRRIVVRVPKRDDLLIRHKIGYYGRPR